LVPNGDPETSSVIVFTPLPGKMTGRLRITPKELLVAIAAQALVKWALSGSSHLQPPLVAVIV